MASDSLGSAILYGFGGNTRYAGIVVLQVVDDMMVDMFGLSRGLTRDLQQLRASLLVSLKLSVVFLLQLGVIIL